MPTTTPQPDPFECQRLSLHIQDALYQLKAAILHQANHQLEQVNLALHKAGIDDPQGAAGVRDLARQRDIKRDAIVDQMKEHVNSGITIEQRQDNYFMAGVREMIDFVENYDAS